MFIQLTSRDGAKFYLAIAHIVSIVPISTDGEPNGSIVVNIHEGLRVKEEADLILSLIAEQKATISAANIEESFP